VPRLDSQPAALVVRSISTAYPPHTHRLDFRGIGLAAPHSQARAKKPPLGSKQRRLSRNTCAPSKAPRRSTVPTRRSVFWLAPS